MTVKYANPPQRRSKLLRYDKFLNENLKTGVKSMRSLFPEGILPLAGTIDEDNCKVTTKTLQFAPQQHQAVVFYFARRLCMYMRVHGRHHRDRPTGMLAYHSTGSGKTIVAALIFTAFYDSLATGVSQGRAFSKNTDISSVSYTHPLLGVMYTRQPMTSIFRHSSERKQCKDSNAKTFFTYMNRNTMSDKVGRATSLKCGILRSVQSNRPHAIPGSHRKVIYISTKEAIASNPNFPEKELLDISPEFRDLKQAMSNAAWSTSKKYNTVTDRILQDRGVRLEVMTFIQLATILFGPARSLKHLQSYWDRGGVPSYNPKASEGGYAMVEGSVGVVVDPYYLVDTVVIIDEVQNLFKPPKSDRNTVERYAQLRSLLGNGSERMKKVNAQRRLESHADMPFLPHDVGRCFNLSLFVLSATPGSNQGQMQELVNMLKTPNEFERSQSVDISDASKLRGRISYVNMYNDLSRFPRKGPLFDYLHEVTMDKKSTSNLKKRAKASNCQDGLNGVVKGNKHVEKEMRKQFGSYFEHPAELKKDERSGLLVPVAVSDSCAKKCSKPSGTVAKPCCPYKENPAYKEKFRKGGKGVVAWVVYNDNNRVMHTVKGSLCDHKTLAAHDRLSNYRIHERNATTAASMSGTNAKIQRLREVLTALPGEKHYVYYGLHYTGTGHYTVNIKHLCKSIFHKPPLTTAEGFKNIEYTKPWSPYKGLPDNINQPLSKPNRAKLANVVNERSPWVETKTLSQNQLMAYYVAGRISERFPAKFDIKRDFDSNAFIRNKGVLDRPLITKLKSWEANTRVKPVSRLKDIAQSNKFAKVSSAYEFLDPSPKLWTTTTTEVRNTGYPLPLLYKGKPLTKKPRYSVRCIFPRTDYCYEGNVASMMTIFNHPSNKHGEYMHVLVASQRFNESMDLKDVKHVHILAPHTSETDKKQTVGRSARNCSMKNLPMSKRITHTHTYYALDNNGVTTIDHAIDELAKGVSLDDSSLRSAAVDCRLTSKLHNVKYDINGKLYDMKTSDKDYISCS